MISKNFKILEMSEKTYRLVVLGSRQVGKTAIIRRFLFNEFDEKYKETIEELYAQEFMIQVYDSLTVFIYLIPYKILTNLNKSRYVSYRSIKLNRQL